MPGHWSSFRCSMTRWEKLRRKSVRQWAWTQPTLALNWRTRTPLPRVALPRGSVTIRSNVSMAFSLPFPCRMGFWLPLTLLNCVVTHWSACQMSPNFRQFLLPIPSLMKCGPAFGILSNPCAHLVAVWPHFEIPTLSHGIYSSLVTPSSLFVPPSFCFGASSFLSANHRCSFSGASKSSAAVSTGAPLASAQKDAHPTDSCTTNGHSYCHPTVKANNHLASDSHHEDFNSSSSSAAYTAASRGIRNNRETTNWNCIPCIPIGAGVDETAVTLSVVGATLEDMLAEQRGLEKDQPQESKLSPKISVMLPVFRFLQLLCENHNRDLQVQV